jgi:hypothetical protein
MPDSDDQRELCDPLTSELIQLAFSHMLAHQTQAEAARVAGDAVAEMVAGRATMRWPRFLTKRWRSCALATNSRESPT